jgi:hypothetical protein
MWAIPIAVMASILIGFVRVDKLRTLLLLSWWLLPLWVSLWFTITYSTDIEFEFGAWWAYLAFTPLFLAVWATVTTFPFMLTVRLRKIRCGIEYR